MITSHDNSGGKIVYVKNDSVGCVCDSSVTKLGTKRKKFSDDSVDIRTEYFPDDVTKSLQEMVDKKGGKGCVVSGNYRFRFGIIHVVCYNSGPRVCLANKDRPKHDNENAYLQLKSGQVHYRCYIQRCKDESNDLGPYPILLKEFIAAHGEARSPQGGGKRVCVDLGVVDVELQADKPKTRTLKEFQLHQPHPVLNSHYVNLAKPFLNNQYLKADMYDDDIRIHVVESSCNTGKTTSVINYAKSKNLKILALAPLISQLEAHEEAFAKKGEITERYDNLQLNLTEIGSTYLVSTIDSIAKIVAYLKRLVQNSQEYILFLDEFHSIVQYLYSSTRVADPRTKSW